MNDFSALLRISEYYLIVSSPLSLSLSTFYPDYTKAWNVGVCTNARPLPSGRPEYQTAEACCSGAYASQGNQWGSNGEWQ